jgi:outer membrane protein assembly factor BamB
VQPGFDAGRSHWNAGESTITAANVDDVAPLWAAAAAGGPVATYGRLVYVQDGLVVTALDATTGAARWSVDLVAAGLPAEVVPDGPPVVAGGTLSVPWEWFLRGGRSRIDAATGTLVELGTADNGSAIAPAAVVADRLVPASAMVLGSSFLIQASMGFTYTPTFWYTAFSGPGPGTAFAIVGDRVAWSFGTEATGFGPACPAYPPPGPGVPAPPGCAPDWHTELGATPTAVAALGPDRVAYTDATGTVTVLDVATGAVAWTAELGSATSDPVVAGSTLFVGAGGQLAAFPATGCGAATCSPAWTAPGGAAIAGGDVVYTSSGGDVLAYPAAGCGAATCAPLVTLSVEGTEVAPAIVDGGRLFAVTSDGRTVAFGLP